MSDQDISILKVEQEIIISSIIKDDIDGIVSYDEIAYKIIKNE